MYENHLLLKYFKKSFLFIVLALTVSSCCKQNPKILFETEYGNIIVEVYPEKAPITTTNFLQYVEENRLQDATFYRAVTMENQEENDIKIEVIQGGLFEDIHPMYLPPIIHETTKETGILHEDGVISMARMEPGTVTCEFFICVGDQPSLDFGGKRNPDGQGFAAFGHVVEGMEIVRKIHQSPVDGQWLSPRIKIVNIQSVK